MKEKLVNTLSKAGVRWKGKGKQGVLTAIDRTGERLTYLDTQLAEKAMERAMDGRAGETESTTEPEGRAGESVVECATEGGAGEQAGALERATEGRVGKPESETERVMEGRAGEMAVECATGGGAGERPPGGGVSRRFGGAEWRGKGRIGNGGKREGGIINNLTGLYFIAAQGRR